jgi:hypothetical protein
VGIQKLAAWATIGSFFVSFIALVYLVWPKDPNRGNPGVSSLPLSVWILVCALLIAGILHFAAAVIQRKEVPVIGPVPAPSPSPLPVTVPAAVSLPSIRVEGRNFVSASVTPEYLLSLFEDHTSIQAQRLIEPFIGKWMSVSGSLDEVISSNPKSAQVTFSGRGLSSNLARIYMYFRTEDSVERLSILRRGDGMIVVGQITLVNAVQLDLDNCELEV